MLYKFLAPGEVKVSFEIFQISFGIKIPTFSVMLTLATMSLDFGSNLYSDTELSLTFIIGRCLAAIWEARGGIIKN